MKRLVALLLALGILVLAAPIQADKEDKKTEKKEDKDKKDKASDDKGKLTPAQVKELKKLSGTFSVVQFEEEGKKRSDEELKKMKVVQKGADWTFDNAGKLTTGKDTVYPDKNPKQIDSHYVDAGDLSGKTVQGIYAIDGDTIKYCWAETGQERPKEFATTPKSKTTFMILKRVKEEKPADKKDKAPKEKEKDKAPKEKEKDKAPKDKGKDKDKDKDKDKGSTDKDK